MKLVVFDVQSPGEATKRAVLRAKHEHGMKDPVWMNFDPVDVDTYVVWVAEG